MYDVYNWKIHRWKSAVALYFTICIITWKPLSKNKNIFFVLEFKNFNLQLHMRRLKNCVGFQENVG